LPAKQPPEAAELADAQLVERRFPTDEEQPAPEDVAVRYIGSGTFVVAGSVTGASYSFQGHGATLLVDPEDAPALLYMERRRQRCCGRGLHVIRLFTPAST